jgi:hypothetical protein
MFGQCFERHTCAAANFKNRYAEASGRVDLKCNPDDFWSRPTGRT